MMAIVGGSVIVGVAHSDLRALGNALLLVAVVWRELPASCGRRGSRVAADGRPLGTVP